MNFKEKLKNTVNNKWYELIVITIFAIFPISGVIGDWINTVIEKRGLITADVSFFAEYEFFSIWEATLISVYGIVKFINFFRKDEDKNKWAESDTTLAIIVSYSFIVCLMYTQTFIMDRDNIVGFRNPIEIIKAVIEHWIIPPLLIFYYLTKQRSKSIGNVEFMKTKWWTTIILPLLYILFILIRWILLVNYHKQEYKQLSNEVKINLLFPYNIIDPTDKGAKGIGILVFSIISFPVTCFLICSLFNKLSNLSNRSLYLNDVKHLEEIKYLNEVNVKSKIEKPKKVRVRKSNKDNKQNTTKKEV